MYCIMYCIQCNSFFIHFYVNTRMLLIIALKINFIKKKKVIGFHN